MSAPALPEVEAPATEDFPVDHCSVLTGMPDPMLVVRDEGGILFANIAAEDLFQRGSSYLRRKSIKDIVPFDSPLLALISQVNRDGYAVAEYGVDIGLNTTRTDARYIDLQVAPVPDMAGVLLVVLKERGIAHALESQLTHQGAARRVTGMAAMLAHEIKNPLSGIRGAAQLIEQNANESDRELTRLICDEVDRIRALVERMDVFSDQRPIERGPVNIHQVLEHVRKIAQTGFGREVALVEQYDPSLPPVSGNRDQLIQACLNLVKNASEAAGPGGEVKLSTRYSHGVRLALPGSHDRRLLPIEITITDNGPGVPEELKPHLFDPFVTTKMDGAGLGLALVAKVVGDHGGVIECDSRPKRTTFRLLLPAWSGKEGKT
jgi:two-component system nitrogen regulation sensor histidine kinase GlnL